MGFKCRSHVKTKMQQQNNNPNFFVEAFKERLGRTPNEYISQKLERGSRIEDVEYLFNIISAQISSQNNCKYFDFRFFYKAKVSQQPACPESVLSTPNKPENSGKFWTREEEQLLIKMYNSGATKKEMCDTFKRTENGLAARLVKLEIIQDKDIFFALK